MRRAPTDRSLTSPEPNHGAKTSTLERLSLERLREVLGYDPLTGHLVRKRCSWRPDVVGRVCGSHDRRGYLCVSIDHVTHKAHRLAWFHHYGVRPQFEIDHINGIKDDNRIANLRDVPGAINCQNVRKANSRSSTGVLGVFREGNRFRACVVIGRKQRRIGTFDTVDEASAAYLQVKREIHAGCTL